MADLNGDGGWIETATPWRANSSPSASRHLSFCDAAALPMVFLSAFAGLCAAVQAGDTVYIPGGGGGVGHLAVQMSARVLGTGLAGRPNRPRWPSSQAPGTFSTISATTSQRKSRS
jgi:NADPH:quinone reductase-like Zn-dependent oxidoreductase